MLKNIICLHIWIEVTINAATCVVVKLCTTSKPKIMRHRESKIA